MSRQVYGKKSVSIPAVVPGAPAPPHKKGRLNARNADVSAGPVTRVKTDGRIGSVTPPSYLKGGLTVNNNSDAQTHSGGLGSAAASHMSPSHGGEHWSPRVAKARAVVSRTRDKSGFRNPINVDKPALKRVKPS